VSVGYEDLLATAGSALLAALRAFEDAQRRLHPPALPELRAGLEPIRSDLARGLIALRQGSVPDFATGFHDRFVAGAGAVLEGLDLFVEVAGPDEAIGRILGAMRRFTHGLESLYAVHRIPPLSRYFVEPPYHDRLEALDPAVAPGVSVGLHMSGNPDHRNVRGGFCLYVPERYDGSAELPLVVALHGGSGDGRSFLWTWLREARGRGFLLLAPTAQGPTWSMIGPDIDGAALRSMVEYVGSHWRVNSGSILLTGLSDGATYALLTGLSPGSPFTALAPLSGVLHPACLAEERREQVRGRRIFLVHGSLDWMFPVQTARWAHEELQAAGADIVFREVADLSHTYAREQNDAILSWFDPALALP
jgi:phospholipase/carboxylesterase